MKGLSKLALLLLFAFYFCVGFAIVFKLLTPFIDGLNTESVENAFRPDYEVLAFTKNDVEIIALGKLEDFKRQNPDFTFLVSKEAENDLTERLFDKMRNVSEKDRISPIFTIEVVRLSEQKQLIRLTSDDLRSTTTNTYEANRQEIFPKTAAWSNMRYTPLKMLGSFVGGTVACFVFFFIYNRKRFT